MLTTHPKTLLSLLWIYLSLNYIYCDHLGIMEPETFKSLMKGNIGAIPVTQEFLLAAALLLQIPFAMVVLSQILNTTANRLANATAASTLIAVQLGTMGMGSAPDVVYTFYSVLEIAASLLIIRIAWRGLREEQRATS